MTEYNTICRRSHLPREASIRRLMGDTGVELSLYGPSTQDILEEEPAEPLADCDPEAAESEEEIEEDPCC